MQMILGHCQVLQNTTWRIVDIVPQKLSRVLSHMDRKAMEVKPLSDSQVIPIPRIKFGILIITHTQND